ncbi:hypothetical protein BJ684DRAFT_22079 [Piptocephalis cylindrospora]|uniref:VWFA domain-containing protein n=1 Tax=Piptocephalis cylindrospora TaxID=1907219 RepID=A0A4P9Y032_9FUNG|nr:hypothetical protein BJ684DRAFT_22079 [Piptocephalis cylindrospora]|eukprot:RKP11361.1 hypothetical protein BJ684DRAFT_22079 [Piptocephalis cylindrospora]
MSGGKGQGEARGRRGQGEGFVVEEDGLTDDEQNNDGIHVGGPKNLINGRTQQVQDIDQMSMRTPENVSKKVTEAQRAMHDTAVKEKLSQLKMTMEEAEKFRQYQQGVTQETQELRLILKSVDATRKERVWLKGQTSGEVDDSRLVDGLAGEKNIYRRRGVADDRTHLMTAARPKRLHIIMDVSASMFRFNAHDGRLDRSLEAALMMMEALQGLERQFTYSLSGHSGDGAKVVFVPRGNPPKTTKEMFSVLDIMEKHTRFCLAGDNTLQAIDEGIQMVSGDDGSGVDYDDRLVIVLSDANLQQYSIKPTVIGAGKLRS